MDSNSKLSVGYQLPDPYRLADIVAEYADCIGEVYFPWLGISTGRGISLAYAEDQKAMEAELIEIKQLGIKLNLLWNANCYGGKAISVELEEEVCDTIKYLFKHIGIDAVTTTSLFVAEIIKTHFPEIGIRASVNMEIASVSGMKYVKNYFDSFYIARALNRYPQKIKILKQWCEANNKKLFLLANSGCLRDCSAHSFHDNLVSHESELNKQRNRWNMFNGICWDYYSDENNHASFVSDSTWLRPEDIDAYDGLVDGIKLATRVHRNPGIVIDAYAERKFNGNALSLCEPDFSGLCHIDNKSFPTGWIDTLSGLNDKEYEKYCQEIFERVKR